MWRENYCRRANRGRSGGRGVNLPHICETWTPWVSINLSIMTGGQAAPPMQQSLSMPLRLKSFASQCSSRPAMTVGTAAVTDTLCSKIKSATDLPSSLGPEQFSTSEKGVGWSGNSLQSNAPNGKGLLKTFSSQGTETVYKASTISKQHIACCTHATLDLMCVS